MIDEQAMGPGEGPEETQEHASPEEQAQYQRAMFNGMRILHGREFRGMVQQWLRQGLPGLSQALVWVVQAVVKGLAEKREPVTQPVLLGMARKLAMDLVFTASQAGQDVRPEDADRVFQLFINLFMGEHAKEGTLNMEGAEAAGMPPQVAGMFGRGRPPAGRGQAGPMAPAGPVDALAGAMGGAA